MKTIKLTKGYVAIVDTTDYSELSKFKWTASVGRGAVYAYRKSPDGEHIYMHRAILRAKKGKVCDHIDGDGLNNRRKNLRLVTQAENTRNKKIHRENPIALGTKRSKSGRFYSGSKINGKYVHFGSFDTQKEAHEAYLQGKSLQASDRETTV